MGGLGLLSRADQYLVDRDVPWPGHDVGDRIRDVLGAHRLHAADLAPHDSHRLGPAGGQVGGVLARVPVRERQARFSGLWWPP